jgi:hypothetical protein
VFADLESLAAWSKGRYRAVHKACERVEELAVDPRARLIRSARRDSMNGMSAVAPAWPQ